jgi:hypothetical protein
MTAPASGGAAPEPGLPDVVTTLPLAAPEPVAPLPVPTAVPAALAPAVAPPLPAGGTPLLLAPLLLPPVVPSAPVAPVAGEPLCEHAPAASARARDAREDEAYFTRVVRELRC